MTTTQGILTWIDCLVLLRSEKSLIPKTENSSKNALLTRSLFSYRGRGGGGEGERWFQGKWEVPGGGKWKPISTMIIYNIPPSLLPSFLPPSLPPPKI